MSAPTIVLHQPSDNTAAWLAFVAALVVALIAAGTAQWRQHVQLKHERQRQTDELAHDRAMKDLDGARALLDETAKHGDELNELWRDLVWAVADGADPDTIKDLGARIGSTHDRLTADSLRLTTRALDGAAQAVAEGLQVMDIDLVNRILRKRINGEDTASDATKLRESLDELTNARASFYTAARQIAGTKLPQA